jgi:hypothetical protein
VAGVTDLATAGMDVADHHYRAATIDAITGVLYLAGARVGAKALSALEAASAARAQASTVWRDIEALHGLLDDAPALSRMQNTLFVESLARTEAAGILEQQLAWASTNIAMASLGFGAGGYVGGVVSRY